MGKTIMDKLREFKVNATLVNIVEGPTVTQFALKPGHGVRVEKIAILADDLQLALKAKSLRIFAPIPGEEAVGVQVSNANPQIVYFREIIESEKWQEVATWPKNGKPKYPVPLLLGKNVSGEAVVADLTRMPHLLVPRCASSELGVGGSRRRAIPIMMFRRNTAALKYDIICYYKFHP